MKRATAEPNREQKKDGRAENKGNAKLVLNSATDKTAETPAGVKYTVKKGDSLNRIAGENNTTPDKLRQLNNLSNDQIFPGQVVLVK